MQLGMLVQVCAALFRYDVRDFLKLLTLITLLRFITIFLIIIVTLSIFNLNKMLLLLLSAGKAPAVDESLAVQFHSIAIDACELFRRVLNHVCHPFHLFTF